MTALEVVWENTVDDGVWGCKVVRTEPYVGQLTVWKAGEEDKLILDEQVTLSFDALFGPDVSDLAMWQDKIIGAIDAQTEEKEEKSE